MVEARAGIGMGEVALIRERFSAPIDRMGAGAEHHLQLSMISTDEASACFPERWDSKRFERMGDLFLVPARWPMRARSTCRRQQSIVCNIDPDRAAIWFEADLEWTDPRLVGSLDIRNTEVRRLLYRIAGELRSPGFAGEAMIELIAAQICVELSRHFRGIESGKASGGLPPWRLRRIDDALEADPGNATLAGLAALCGLSVRHLTRAFRATRGQSLGDYIAEKRIDRARHLLASGAPVWRAAEATGFTAASNFATAFRRATGYSPRQYRDLAKR